MRECTLGCITIIFPGRQKRRSHGRGEDDLERRQHVPRHIFHYAPTGHDSSPRWRRSMHGSGPGANLREPAFPDHDLRGGNDRGHPQLPAVNRGRPLETIFVDPSRSFTIRYDRRRQFGV
ncbi:hypothetical protein CGRA01v4_00013 [Colletotrichum graminicola]|nr:hypothetical protein CGRA01v4_00013 [Colletotrichum graminicola]